MGIVEDRIRQRQLEAGAKATTLTVSPKGETLGIVERRMLERGLPITRAPKTVNVSFTDGTTKKVPSADFQNFLNAVKEDNKKYGIASQVVQSFENSNTSIPKTPEEKLLKQYEATFTEDFWAKREKEERDKRYREIDQGAREWDASPHEFGQIYTPHPGMMQEKYEAEIRAEIGKNIQREKSVVEDEMKELKETIRNNAITDEVAGNSDFEENSKYSPRPWKTDEELKAEGYTKANDGSWYKTSAMGTYQTYKGEDRELYTYINDESARTGIDAAQLSLNGSRMYLDAGYDQLTDKEKGAFNYLYHQDRKNGTNTAEEYLIKIKPMLQKRAMEKETSRYAEIAKEYPVASSIFSFGTNLLDTAMLPAKVTALATGDYDESPWLDKYSNQTQTIRGTVSEDMPWYGRLGYNAGMSIGDMLIATGIGGGNSKMIQLLMSSSAASSEITNAKANGANDAEALIRGIGSGAIEWATEKYSIEALLKEPKKIGGYILKNMGTEAAEEGASNIANVILDDLVSKAFAHENEFEKKVNELVDDKGMTQGEAFKTVFMEYVLSFAQDVATGALSGGGTSSVIASPAIATKTAEKITGRKGETIIKEAPEAGVEIEGMPRVKIPESMNPASSGEATGEKSYNISDMVENPAPITPGFVRNEYSKNIGNKTIRALDAIAKRIGVEIEIGEPTGEFGDNGVYNNGRIAIAKDAKVLKAVLSHEVTHYMQRTAPAEYNAFVELAVNASEKISGAEKAELINRYRQEYANGIESFSDQEAIDEITADYASLLVDDVSLFRELANSDKNVAQRFIDAVRDFLKKISTVFSKNAADKAAIEKYGTDVEGLKKVVAQWESMLATTEEAVSSGNINTADMHEDGGVKRMIKRIENESGNDYGIGRKENTGNVKEYEVGKKYSIKDSDYMSAVEKGDMETAQRMVDEAAEKSGFNSPKLYHGTDSFGYTEFDLEKSDDKRTIFLTNNEKIASTYSGVTGKRAINDIYGKDVNSMSAEDLSSELNYFVKEYYKDTFEEHNYNYEYYNLGKLNALINSVNERLGGLKSEVEDKIKEYAEKMSLDFDDETARIHRQLVQLKERIDKWDYDNLSTPIYLLIHHSDALKENSLEYGTLEADIRLMNQLRKNEGINDGVVVEESLGRYSIETMNIEEAREKLRELSKKGNYALYAKLGTSLVIDGKGQNWNDIQKWTDYVSEDKGFSVESDADSYYLKNETTGKQLKGVSVAKVNASKLSEETVKELLVAKYKNMLAITGETIKTTRGIAKFAKENGYDSVVIKDIKDNGGRNYNIGMEETADIYIVFNENQVKSADAVTYDDNGNVIPLSERFNEKNPDIRYSKKTGDLLSKDYKPREAGVNPQAAELEAEEFRAEPRDTSPRRTEESYIEDTGLDSYFDDLTERANVISDERKREAEAAVLIKPPKREQTFREKMEEAESYAMRKMVNSGYAIRKIADMTNDAHIYGTYNMARSSQNIASDMVHNKQTDILGRKVGDSLEAIIAPIKEKGDDYYRDFQLYLFHKHNVARMSLKNSEAELAAQEAYDEFVKENPSFTRMSEESLERMRLQEDDRGLRARKYIELRDNLKAAQRENKPIFFEEEAIPMSAEESRARAEELLRKNPDFIADEAKVRKYIDNLMDYRIDSGLITQEEADYFRTKYPDYVPTYRDTEGNLRWIEGKANIGKTIGKAKGSNENILPLDVSLAEMTKKVVRNGQKNIFANKLYDLYENNAKSFEKYITDEAEGKRTAEADIEELGENFAENTVSFYKDGRNIELTVTPELFEAFDTLSRKADENPAWLKEWKKAFEVRKKLVTTYDPTFGIRNGFKDLQDALLNSTDARGLLKNLPKAYKEIATGGEMWELYKAAGGLYSSRFEEMQNEGVKFKSKKAKVAEKLTFANMMIEQAPRLAEFITVYEKGDANNPDTLSDALLAAAEVTTNFGESGTVGKVLNAYLVPFLNPGIQGTAKIARTFSGKKTAAQWGKLAAKTALLGLNAAFFNELITALFAGDDEEEYLKNVDDRIKDNYYLIPTGDGKFIKLPKGRVVASLGIINERLRDVIKGEKVDVGEALSRIADNTLPTNPLKENFFTPWFEADLFDEESTGRTWYGTDIESESMQSLPVEERYDSSTDYVSRAIGKALKVSPKKANYIIEQYTGGAGRIVMPMITPSEQKGDNVGETIALGAWSSIASNFSVDAKLSNKVSGEFYDAVTEAEQAKNSKDGTLVDAVVYKHLNRERNQMSSYNKTIRGAENDKNLTSKERRAAVRVATAARTTYQETVLNNLPEYREAVEKYLKKYPGTDEEKRIDYAYREANREIYGAEYAIRVNGGADAYKKAAEKVKRGKTTWKEYYDEYFGKAERRFDKIADRFGISYADFERIEEAISKNSKKADEIAAIEKLGYKRGVARRIRDMYYED